MHRPAFPITTLPHCGGNFSFLVNYGGNSSLRLRGGATSAIMQRGPPAALSSIAPANDEAAAIPPPSRWPMRPDDDARSFF